jgi:hypothetical protein
MRFVEKIAADKGHLGFRDIVLLPQAIDDLILRQCDLFLLEERIENDVWEYLPGTVEVLAHAFHRNDTVIVPSDRIDRRPQTREFPVELALREALRPLLRYFEQQRLDAGILLGDIARAAPEIDLHSDYFISLNAAMNDLESVRGHEIGGRIGPGRLHCHFGEDAEAAERRDRKSPDDAASE